MAIKVGIMGYGTIGKRVADAIMLQKDMQLIGITGNTYNYRMEMANDKKIPIFTLGDKKDFEDNGISPAGNLQNLLDEIDVMVDCTPKKIGKENKEKFYLPNKVKGVFQGGEKADVGEMSFVAQCNYNKALNKDYVRVVSCNTTGLCRTLNAIDNAFGVKDVVATMIRRGADPADIRHGPINSIVPVLELPSHHGPDVQTVLNDMDIVTTALSVPSTLMHMHTLTVELSKPVEVEQVIEVFGNTTRVRLVRNAEKVRSTAEIMELAKDLRRSRGDMPEICIWEEAIGTHNSKLFYMQAIHQESDVVPENIDCIRAITGFEDAQKSIEMTNLSLKIK